MIHYETAADLLSAVADRYDLKHLKDILSLGDKDTGLKEKDIYICLEEILKACREEGDTGENLKSAKNMYGAPIFALDRDSGNHLIENAPDFDRAIKDIEKYSFCFKLSPYHIINTFLAVIEAQISGLDLDELILKGKNHIERLIESSLENNPRWDKNNLKGSNSVLIIPVGAAGSGKSTFYRELSDVLNISCDNIRFLLFSSFGPCFSSWESCLSWWVVNFLTDYYLTNGYDVFYNGVNTDLEYRSPITMEDPDPLYMGIPYDIRIVYFEPPVDLDDEELEELKNINLWETAIEEFDTSSLSPKVSRIMDMIRRNYLRTLARTKEISEGIKEQDPFDVQYAVPAPVVKLFVRQSFDRPQGENVTVIYRKELPDPEERRIFYREYADRIMEEVKRNGV